MNLSDGINLLLISPENEAQNFVEIYVSFFDSHCIYI